MDRNSKFANSSVGYKDRNASVSENFECLKLTSQIYHGFLRRDSKAVPKSKLRF